MEQVFRAKALQEEINALTVEAKERAQARDTAETGTAKAEAAHRTAHSDAESCAEALRRALAALEDGRNRDRAAALRAHLHTGDACPVCMQTVAVLPADEAPPELAGLEKVCKEAEGRAAKAGVANQAAAAALATASARRDEAAKAAEVATTKAADRALGSRQRCSRRYPASCPVRRQPAMVPRMLVWMEQRRVELRAAKVERDRIQAEVHRARGESRQDAHCARRRGGRLTRASDRREQVVKDQTQLQTDTCRGDRPHPGGIPARRSSRRT